MSVHASDEPADVASSIPASAARTSAPAPQQRRWMVLLATLLALVAIGLITHLWFERQELSRLREEMARRLQIGDTVSTEVRGVVKAMQDTVFELRTRIDLLETRQSNSQSQYASLQQMYQELAKSRDDRILTDIEQILLTANQQLQLTSNVHGTLIVLENADRMLARDDMPQFINIRRALARDIERLRAVPYIDVTGMTIKLDTVMAQIGTLPLLSEARARTHPDKEALAANAAGDGKTATDTDEAGQPASWLGLFPRIWARWSSEFWAEIRSLIQVRNVDSPGALMLSASQGHLLRENLTLRLLGARVGILARDHPSFNTDMDAALNVINTYFDQNSPQVRAVKRTLAQIVAENVAVELPTLADSLTAVHNYRTKT